jgi:hypothetical protein
MGDKRWVSLTLTFYVKSYENKQIESCGLTWGQ